MEDTEKKEKSILFYQKSTGYLCFRYPHDYQPESDKDFIEVSEDELYETLECPYGKIWAVRDGSLELIDDAELQATEEYKANAVADEISSLKRYLTDTDYVISKLNELKLEDEEEYEAAKAEYSETLKKRKEARARINELEG